MEYELDAKGRIAMLDKDSLRKRLGGRSPDRMDAAVIALAAASDGIRRPSVSFFDLNP